MNAISQFDLFLTNIQSPENLQRFLAGTKPSSPNRLKDLPRIECADGFSLSVVAGVFHQCFPRSPHGPYETVECAFPSEVAEELLPYQLIEAGYGPEESVYHHVPVTLIVDLINKHGGLPA